MSDELGRIVEDVPFSTNGADLTQQEPSVAHMMLRWVASNDNAIPPYWSYTRDSALRHFVHQSGPLKVAVNTFINKLVTIPWQIIAKDRSITRHVETSAIIEKNLRRNSGSMSTAPLHGFREAMKMFLRDYLTTDNGAFMVVMGNGPADGPIVGPPTGVMHIDSSLSVRTKDPEYPVKYLNAGVGGDNKQYKIHYSRLIQMANLPSPEVDLNGVGLCAVSCCVEAAQELWDIWRYNSELFGSHPPRQILYAETGATVKNLKDAKQAWEATMLNEGRSRFGGTMLMAPRISSQSLKLHILSLSSLPQDFNRRDVTTIDKSEIAAGFGLDLRDLSYTLGAPSRTGDAEVQDRKGRGKGIGEFIETFAERFEQVYLNTDVHEITFDYVDDEQDEQQANVRSIRSQARERDLSSGVTTVRVEREEMWSKGEISRQQFEDMELLDGRLPEGLDVMLLFQSDDRDFSEWLDLGVSDPTDISANDPEEMSNLIHERYIDVSRRIHEERRVNRRRKALQALAALDKLRAMYQTPQGEILDEQATIEAMDEGEEQIEGAEEEAEEEEGEEAEEESLNRELGESKKKQAELIDPILLEFEDQFRFFVEQAVGGEIPRDEFAEAIAQEVALAILLLFLRGSGLSENELTEAQVALISAEIDEALTTLDAFADDIYQGRYDPQSLGIDSAMNRIVGWATVASSSFFLGMMNDPNDPFLAWVIDPMKESCTDCLRLNGQVHRASEWLSSGWRPRKWNLECRGIHCGCELFQTTGPARGRF